jgi:hypothetical protein
MNSSVVYTQWQECKHHSQWRAGLHVPHTYVHSSNLLTTITRRLLIGIISQLLYAHVERFLCEGSNVFLPQQQQHCNHHCRWRADSKGCALPELSLPTTVAEELQEATK